MTHGILANIMGNPQRTTTTWTSGSTWQNGATKTIRIPIALANQIMDYARELDNNNAVTRGIVAEDILEVIERYIEFRQQHYRPNQHSGKPEISSRTWDELRKFQKLVRENPEALNLSS